MADTKRGDSKNPENPKTPEKSAKPDRSNKPEESKQPEKFQNSDKSEKRATEKKPDSSPQKSNRWILMIGIPIAIAAVLAGGCWYVLTHSEAEETQLVLQGNIDVRQVNLAFKVDGRIETLAVDEGDSVVAGQSIATLDKRYFNDDLRVARAHRDNMAASLAKLEHGSRPEEIAQIRAQTVDKESTLKLAKEDFHRASNLVDKGGVSRQEFDRSKSALDSAEAQVRAAHESQRLVEIGPRQEDIDVARALLAEQDATIVQRERRLADADLVAPSDGIILTRARERGAIVQPGETVFTLTLATPVWVRTYVNERDLGLVQPDAQASVMTDTAPKQPYQGKVGFISPTAEFTPKAVETRELRTDLVYRLRIVVQNPDGGLRQGMPVTVVLPLPHPRPRTFWQRARSAFGIEERGESKK